jgi:hypothetical protein
MSVTQEAALKARFAGTETDTLLELWANHERLDWAETILAAELAERGIAPAELASLASARGRLAAEKAVSARDTFVGYGLLGRACAVLLAVAASTMVGALFGKLMGTVAMLLVFLGYVAILAPRLVLQSRQRNGGAVAFVLAYQYLELGLLPVIVIGGMAWVVPRLLA